jgi:hypothetical protein
MKSLLFLLFCSMKNSLRETVRKPARIVLYLFLILIIGMSIAGNAFIQRVPANFKDIHLLGGMFFALSMMFLLSAISRAFKSGGSLFQMSDVNLLFVSPVAPQKILIYGVIQVFKAALAAGLFILFQSVTLGQAFGTGFLSLLLIIGILALCICLSEVIAIVVYSVTNGKPARKRTAKAVIAFVFLPLVITAVTAFVREGDPMAALLFICKSPAFQLIPAPGWCAAAITALLKGNFFTGGFFLALTVAAITGLLILLFRLKSDYYEDVLVATESAFEKKRAIAEGRLGLASAAEQKTRVAKTGISGFGARALFSKHLRETFRESRFGFINTRTLIYTALAAAFAFIKRENPGNLLIFILQYFAWIQVFTIAMGPSLRELYTHYLYLMPEPPLKKLVWNSLTVVLKTGVDAVLIFGIAGTILRENPLIIAGVILAGTIFALMLTGLNIFGLRWTSVDLSAGVLVVIYLFAVIIVLIPGLIPAFAAAHIIPGSAGIIAALAIVSLWEIIISFLCFALSTGILDNCDMPVMKMPK